MMKEIPVLSQYSFINEYSGPKSEKSITDSAIYRKSYIENFAIQKYIQ